MKKTICVIPARGGSKRIPNKNIKDFKGKPIIAYPIDAIKKSGIADTIMVSTDDERIAEIAKKYGAEVPFLRSKWCASDTAGLADVVIEVINQYKKMGEEFTYTVLLLATTPLIKASDLKKAYHCLADDSSADAICSVEAFSYPPQRGLIIRNGKIVMLHPENYYCRSQDLEKIYHDCGQFFIFKKNTLLEQKKLYTKNMLPFVIDEIASQDIDEVSDWRLAEIKYDLLKEDCKI